MRKCRNYWMQIGLQKGRNWLQRNITNSSRNFILKEMESIRKMMKTMVKIMIVMMKVYMFDLWGLTVLWYNQKYWDLNNIKRIRLTVQWTKSKRTSIEAIRANILTKTSTNMNPTQHRTLGIKMDLGINSNQNSNSPNKSIEWNKILSIRN